MRAGLLGGWGGGEGSQCPRSSGWGWVLAGDHSAALCPSHAALCWRGGEGQKADPSPLPSSLPEWSLNERSKQSEPQTGPGGPLCLP